ncbi:transducin/WD40 repeat-like superfamily protein, partial [Tanacetum coccineum]
VLWWPSGRHDKLISINEQSIFLWSLDSSKKSAQVQSQESAGMLHHLSGGAWNPHDVNVVASTSESSIQFWDLRTMKYDPVLVPKYFAPFNYAICFSLHRKTNSLEYSHVRSMDYDSKKEHMLITAADDSGIINIWDLRMLKAPAAELPGHSHWTWAVRSNPEGGKMGGLGDGSRVKIGSGYNMSFLVWSTGQNCPAQSAETDSAVNLWLASPPSNAELTPDRSLSSFLQYFLLDY